MTEREALAPARGSWRWYHTLGVSAALMAGLIGFAAYRIDRSIRHATGSSAAEFIADPRAAFDRGFKVVVVGDVPHAPRGARIALFTTPTGDTTSFTAELRLDDTLASDSAAAWAGRCVVKSRAETLEVVIGAPREAAQAGSVPASLGFQVLSGGSAIAKLVECKEGRDATHR